MRYLVTFVATASHTVEVEAESKKEAEDEAWDAWDGYTLCHQCGAQMDLGDWDVDDSRWGVTEA